MKKLSFPSILLFVCMALGAQDNTQRVNSTEFFICDFNERMALYPEGDLALLKFLEENITWPKVVSDKPLEGRVVLGFTVEKTGEISNIRVLRSLHDSIDAEAIRVVKLMPKWIPAESYNGAKIASYWTLPFKFKQTR